MKIKLFTLLIVPAYLIMLACGSGDVYEENTQATGETGETMSDIADVEIDTTTPEILSTTPDTTNPYETEVPQTENSATEPPKTESTDTELPEEESVAPETTPEHELPNNELRSLGVFELTAYCPCYKCCGEYAINRPVDENGEVVVITASGARAYVGVTIAVDPRVIPYGTQVVINDHTYTAQDTGGVIKGNKIDIYFEDHQEAWDFGVQYAEVFIHD